MINGKRRYARRDRRRAKMTKWKRAGRSKPGIHGHGPSPGSSRFAVQQKQSPEDKFVLAIMRHLSRHEEEEQERLLRLGRLAARIDEYLINNLRGVDIDREEIE